MQEPWKLPLRQPVEDDRLDLLPVAGDALNDAVGLAPAFGRVEQNELPHPRQIVVVDQDV